MNRWTILAAAAALPAAAVPAVTLASETVTFGYDVRGRLITVTRAGGTNDGIVSGYSHDQADNRELLAVTDATAPTFSVREVYAVEGDDIVFTISKSGTTSGTVGVSFQTGDKTAIAGSDYTARPLTALSFAPAETSKTVRVATSADDQPDDDERMYLELSAPTGGAVIAVARAIGTIWEKAPNPGPTTAPDTGSLSRCSAAGTFNVTANDQDPQGPVTLKAVSRGALGGASVASTTSVGYLPGNVAGKERLTYTVEDALGARSQGTLTLTLGPGSGCPADNE
ncbi:MAG TPA: Calx-beta domain-containing protein [Allosphingosinicella sp.]|jgi:chitinase